MLQAHDTLFRVWELAVSFLGLPPLPLVPREKHESQANCPTANDLDCRRTPWRREAVRRAFRRKTQRVCRLEREVLTVTFYLESVMPIRDCDK
jgi:hypothetical protein